MLRGVDEKWRRSKLLKSNFMLEQSKDDGPWLFELLKVQIIKVDSSLSLSLEGVEELKEKKSAVK